MLLLKQTPGYLSLCWFSPNVCVISWRHFFSWQMSWCVRACTQARKRKEREQEARQMERQTERERRWGVVLVYVGVFTDLFPEGSGVNFSRPFSWKSHLCLFAIYGYEIADRFKCWPYAKLASPPLIFNRPELNKAYCLNHFKYLVTF